MEFKRLTLDSAEIKFDAERQFEGYASVFGGVDAYGDTVDPGAFKGTLKGRDRPIRMRWNHFGPVIGKYLEIAEDDKGLRVKGELTPGHTVAENVYASMKHGAVDGLSIGFRVKDYKVIENIRHLKKIDLVEISVVEEPADLGAKVGDVKHLTELINEIDSWKEIEDLLRESGWSRASATTLVSRVKSLALGEREAKSEAEQIIEMLNIRSKANGS